MDTYKLFFDDTEKKKRCSKCGEGKSYEEFHKDKSSKDGHRLGCKECAKQKRKQHHKKNKGHIKQHQVKKQNKEPDYTYTYIKGNDKKYKISRNDCFFSMGSLMGEKNKLDESDIQNTIGVYIFVDWDDFPIRIGKAKKLRNRILSYATNSKNFNIFEKMYNSIQHVSCIYTRSEAEAAYIESDLINKGNPKCNFHGTK